jgi:hypothetical protein
MVFPVTSGKQISDSEITEVTDDIIYSFPASPFGLSDTIGLLLLLGIPS